MGTLIQVQMESLTGLPRDRVVNTYVIGGPQPVAGGAIHGEMRDAIRSLYVDDLPGQGAGVSLSSLMSPELKRVADVHLIKFYDITNKLAGEPTGGPVHTATMTLDAASSAVAWPSEVAMVVTFNAHHRGFQSVEVADDDDADTVPQRPRQRYTGRVYLGPFCQSGLTTTAADGHARPNAGVAASIRDHFAAVMGAFDASHADHFFGVWSRSGRIIRSISEVTTNDDWDTQRRRGVRSTAKLGTLTGVAIQDELNTA